MKQLNFILAIVIAAIAFGACSNELGGEFSPQMAKTRPQSEAIEIAKNAYNNFYEKANRGNTSIDIDNIIPISERTSRGKSGDTLLYVINFADDGGFALVSAQEISKELIGISDEGHYDPSVESGNAGFELFVRKAAAYVENASIAPTLPGDTVIGRPITPGFVDGSIIESCAPKVNVQWGPGAPCGNLFPDSTANSFVTSIAMIFSHTRPFNSFRPTYPGSYGTVPQKWNLICGHIGGDVGCTENPDSLAFTHDMIEILCREIAQDANAYPDFNYSDNDPARYLTFLEHQLMPISSEEIKRTLDNHAEIRYCHDPDGVLASGRLPDLSFYYWIIDGYKVRLRLLPNVSNEIYFHHNWAANGNCNGYFLKDVYDSTEGFQYDNSNNTFHPNVDEVSLYFVDHVGPMTNATNTSSAQ